MRYLIAILILTHATAFAEMDADQKKGLKQTKELLSDPTERQKVINKDPKAKEMDDKVSALAGSSENKEDIYALASKLMEKIAAETNGDPAKMQVLMLEAQKNPEAFYRKYFDAEEKAKVRSVANKIEKKSPPTGNSK